MKKREKLTDCAIFIAMLAAAAAVFGNLFYRQCVESMAGSGLYHSDMKAYILNMQGLESGYSFPYPVLFKLAALCHLFLDPQASMALATLLLNVAGIVAVKVSLEHLCGEKVRAGLGGLPGGLLISFVSLALFFVSMVYPPAGHYLPGIKYTYLGVFTANPFHNATYMAARPFAVLAFLWFVKLLDTYRDGAKLSDYVCFSVFLLLSTMAKPSFTIVMVSAAGIVLLRQLAASGFSIFKKSLLMGLAFLPTFADLLYQFRGVFVPDEGTEGGIGFCLGRIWMLYCDNIPLAVGLAAGFPILVLLCNFREIKTDTLYRFSWEVYLFGFLTAFFCYEKGFREPDFNFSWGYMYGIFFAFFGAVYMLLKKTAEKKKPLLIALQWLAFLWHLGCGAAYFYGIYRGAMYY